MAHPQAADPKAERPRLRVSCSVRVANSNDARERQRSAVARLLKRAYELQAAESGNAAPATKSRR
jgi:hypothetical protein